MAAMDDNPIVTCELNRSLLPRHLVSANRWAMAFALMVVVLSVLGLSIAGLRLIARASRSEALDAQALYERVQDGQDAAVLRDIALLAEQQGGWVPAPGDVIVYEPDLPPMQRGATRMVDDLPVRCTDPRLIYTEGIDSQACIEDYQVIERQLRFGPSTFTNPLEDGSRARRQAVDDALATYLEEVVHSWQEYLYETEGYGQGPRTRSTSAEAGQRWAHGIEYQAKMYVLSLDGNLLSLSDEQQQELRAAICLDEGYANPLGHPVPSYGLPSGWPNPQGWPTAAPTMEEFKAFCDALGT
jgi:hypothetical protein